VLVDERTFKKELSSLPGRHKINMKRSTQTKELTAHAPATEATIPPDIIIGRTPLVLLKSIPLSAPARILFAESCFPRRCPMKELKPL
jgi:hypothetical protein